MVQDVTVKTRSENALGVSTPFLYYRKCLDPTDKTTVSTKRNSKFLVTFFFFFGGGGQNIIYCQNDSILEAVPLNKGLKSRYPKSFVVDWSSGSVF